MRQRWCQQRKADKLEAMQGSVREMEAAASNLQSQNASLEAEAQQLRSIVVQLAGDRAALAEQVRELGGCVPAQILASINLLSAGLSSSTAG
jgi:cell division protein FtsB